MLILSGISISMLTSDKKILINVQNARAEAEKVSEMGQVKLDILISRGDGSRENPYIIE